MAEACHHSCPYRGCTFQWSHNVNPGAQIDDYWRLCADHAFQAAQIIQRRKQNEEARKLRAQWEAGRTEHDDQIWTNSYAEPSSTEQLLEVVLQSWEATQSVVFTDY